MALSVCIFLASCSDVGDSFDSYDEFMKYQQEDGFIFIGRFKDQWPATIMEVQTAENEITFEMKNSGGHRYSGFDGYELKMVRLETAGGAEAVIVLRSKEKK